MAATAPYAKPPLRILLVDDDLIFGDILTKLAANYPVEMVHVSSVRKAYQISTRDFDVLLLDFRLGRVTGVQLSRFYEHFGSPERIFLISAASDVDREDWPPCVRGFLTKTMGARTLLERVLDAARPNESLTARDLQKRERSANELISRSPQKQLDGSPVHPARARRNQEGQ